MSFISTHNFLKTRGFDAFMAFYDALEKGAVLREIALTLGVSISRAAQLKDAFFEQHYFFRGEVEEAVEFYLKSIESSSEEKRTRYKKVRTSQDERAVRPKVLT